MANALRLLEQPVDRLTLLEKRKIEFHDKLIQKAAKPARAIRYGEDDCVEIPGLYLFGCSLYLKKQGK